MASTTSIITFSSSSSLCTTTRRFPHHHFQNPLQLPLSHSKTHFNFLSLQLQRLTLSSRNSISPLTVNSSQTEPTVVAAVEPDDEPTPPQVGPQSGPSLSISQSRSFPKVNGTYAVVMVGSRQYIVIPGRWINVQKLKGANVDDKIVLNKVLLVRTKDKCYIGKPIVANAVVHAVVEEQLKDKKVIVFKYKKKKNYRRNIGHRQPITRIKIEAISGYEDYPAYTIDS